MLERQPRLEDVEYHQIDHEDQLSGPRRPKRQWRGRVLFRWIWPLFAFVLGSLATSSVLQRRTMNASIREDDRMYKDLVQTMKSGIEDTESATAWAESPLRNVLPVRCHSHNDYLRQVPLYAALASGCTGVEADVWNLDGDLYVGHEERSLMQGVTLTSTYLAPLQKLLSAANSKGIAGNMSSIEDRGLFALDPNQSLVLLIDFKNDFIDTYGKVDEQLKPLRDLGALTHWNGSHIVRKPITIVASRHAPFDMIIANTTYRDIFFDAPLSNLEGISDEHSLESLDSDEEIDHSKTSLVNPRLLNYKYNPSNSYYASTKFDDIVSNGMNFLTDRWGDDKLKGMIQQARIRGLVPRYWGTPRWPRSYRDYTWGVLMDMKIGVLNVDDLRAARKGQWGSWAKMKKTQKWSWSWGS